ncbi:Hypothetical predicted protein [Mytilus galloprovincialis]|uniref:Uncharacterized protein n=1 Tax=Mytilus galloprovincialis TaxID=29158 RepID=A0A8B6C316_MYTGA|nr:Hypothetical predicted protein [Mytilus galloprovincialis]
MVAWCGGGKGVGVKDGNCDGFEGNGDVKGGGGGGGVGGGVGYVGDEAVRGDNGGDGVCSGRVYVDGGGKDGGSYIGGDGDNCWEGGDGYDSGEGEGDGGYIGSGSTYVGRYTGGGDNCAEGWEDLVDSGDGNIGVDGCETEESGDIEVGGSAELGSFDNYDGNRGDGMVGDMLMAMRDDVIWKVGRVLMWHGWQVAWLH